MDTSQISGDVVIFCSNSNFILCITQALGLTKNKTRVNKDKFYRENTDKPPTSTNSTQYSRSHNTLNSNKEPANLFNSSFDYYQDVNFSTTTHFEDVMISDVHFFKKSFHMHLVGIKEMYDRCNADKNIYLGKSVTGFKEQDVDAIVEIPMETITVSHRIYGIAQSVVNNIKDVQQTKKDKVVHIKVHHRERSSSTTAIDSKMSVPEISDVVLYSNTPKLFRKKLVDIYSAVDNSGVDNNEKASDVNLIQSNGDSSKGNINPPKDSDEDLSISTVSDDIDSGALSRTHYLGYNYVHGANVNIELTNIYETYSKNNWKFLYNMIKYWGFSLADAKDFTEKRVLEKQTITAQILGKKTDDYVGISTSVINEGEITCVNMNLFIPTDWSSFTHYTLKNILKGHVNKKSDTSDSGQTETESDEEDIVTSDETGYDVDDLIPANIFDKVRPIKPLCYIIFVDLLNDADMIEAELDALFRIIKHNIAVDSAVGIDVEWASKTKSKTAKNIIDHILQSRFDKNRSFVAIIGHSASEIPLLQLREKIRKLQPDFETDTADIDKNTNIKKKVSLVEKSVEVIQKLGKKLFGKQFIYYNIDITIPRQVVLTFQKIATIILRQSKFVPSYKKPKSTMEISKMYRKTSGTMTNTINHFLSKNPHMSLDEARTLACLKYFFGTLLHTS